jgi:LacI family transcriptional regulator
MAARIPSLNVNLRDIAAECAVTAQTASGILNGGKAHLYRKETVEQVRRAAKLLGYRPNASAQAIRTGRFHCISLLTSPIHYYTYASAVVSQGVQETFAELGYNVLLNTLSSDRFRAGTELPHLFRENHVDGVVVAITHGFPDWFEGMVLDLGLPVVWLGSKHAKDCVHHDDHAAARRMTRELIAMGHRRIAYAHFGISAQAPGVLHFSVQEREDGYAQAMREAGLSPLVARPPQALLDNEVVAFAGQVLSEMKPTAILAYDLTVTGRALFYAACRAGIDIPRDLSFVTFHSEETCENDLRISRLAANSRVNDAQVAARLLHDKILDRGVSMDPVVLEFEYVPGETVVPPPLARARRPRIRRQPSTRSDSHGA